MFSLLHATLSRDCDHQYVCYALALSVFLSSSFRWRFDANWREPIKRPPTSSFGLSLSRSLSHTLPASCSIRVLSCALAAHLIFPLFHCVLYVSFSISSLKLNHSYYLCLYFWSYRCLVLGFEHFIQFSFS